MVNTFIVKIIEFDNKFGGNILAEKLESKLEEFFSHFLSPGSSSYGCTQTLNFRVVRSVFYHQVL